ncbi:unnamed protein product [Coregonus sp. 'balchen']|nr:unnamed protein product [Coregonus sp. 'balchen']
MVLRESPFPNCFVEGLHAVGWGLILPCFWFLDRLIAVCMSTSLERTQRHEQECYLHPLKVFFGFILFLALFLVTAPLAFLGFLLWAPLQAARRPFSYHQEPPSRPAPADEGERNLGFEAGANKATFGFATANLCLLPDGIARFNNLGHTQRRATAIGRSIVQGVNRPHIRIFVDSPSSCGTLSPSSSLLPGPSTTSPVSYGATDPAFQPPPQAPPTTRTKLTEQSQQQRRPPKPSDSNCVVYVPCDDTEDPSPSPAPVINTNQNSNQQGRKGHRNPPRALHTQGVAQRGQAGQDDVPWEVSSLFPANVDILCLEEVFDKRAALKLTNTLGPLFNHILYDVGVYAWQPPGSCSSFKFFNSGLFLASRYPVLEAQYHCEGEIRCEQLNMITKWIQEFQATNSKPEEVVVLEQKHSLFEEYRDPCRVGPGQEKPWVIGTLLEQPTLYHEDYISSPVALDGCPLVYPELGQPWVGRRIDYILYRESSISKHCQTEIEEFTFVTQLAGLTDHIPVGLRLNVILDSDNAQSEE